MDYNKIHYDPLSEEMRHMADIIGKHALAKLLEAFGGCQIYFPKPEGIFRYNRDQQIRNEFNGTNYKDIARKYGLSVARIRHIIRTQRRYRHKT